MVDGKNTEENGINRVSYHSKCTTKKGKVNWSNKFQNVHVIEFKVLQYYKCQRQMKIKEEIIK